MTEAGLALASIWKVSAQGKHMALSSDLMGSYTLAGTGTGEL